MVIYDCSRICECKEPDFNDTLLNEDNEACVHCDICGGIPETEQK